MLDDLINNKKFIFQSDTLVTKIDKGKQKQRNNFFHSASIMYFSYKMSLLLQHPAAKVKFLIFMTNELTQNEKRIINFHFHILNNKHTHTHSQI